jgi:hypothetical protein
VLWDVCRHGRNVATEVRFVVPPSGGLLL